jgi:hypothetical protein
MGASNWDGLAIPKPEPRKKAKARARRDFAKKRKAAREETYKRDGGRCVRCGKRLYLNPSDEGADWFNVANINEIKPRSLGGDPLDSAGQNTLCAGCHTGKGHHVK